MKKYRKNVYILERIWLHNFWLFEDVDLDFSFLNGSSVVFVEGINHDATDAKSNWTGKTTLMINAIEWIFEGKYSRLHKVDDVVGTFDRYAMGSITLRLGKSLVTITRYRKHPKYKNQVSIHWDSKDMTGERIIESRSMLEKILDIDINRFMYGALFHPDKPNLFDLKPAARNKLLANIWELERFEAAASICGSMCGKLDKKLLGVVHKIESKRELIVEISESINILNHNNKTFLEEKQKKINLLGSHREEISLTIAKRERIERALTKTKKERHNIRDRILELKRKLVKSSGITDKITTQRGRIEGIKERIKAVTERADGIRADIDKDRDTGIMCDICGSIVTKKGHRRLIESKQEGLREIRKRRSDLKVTLNRARSRMRNLFKELKRYNIDRLHDSITMATKELVEGNLSIAEYKLLLRGIKRMNSSLEDIKERIKEEKASRNPYRKQLESKQDQYGDLDIELDDLLSIKKRLNRDFHANRFWVRGFKRLRNLILTERVDLFGQEFQAHLDPITDGSISGTWSVKQDTGDIVDALFDSISKEEKHYYGFSSAQRAKLRFAVNIAMSRLCAPNIGFMVIDEMADQNIDEVGFRKLIEYLNSRKDLGKTVFLISHNQIAAQMSDAILRIERRGNKATAMLVV